MPKVLIVEDSVTVREQVGRALTPAGFEVLFAHDGVEGLKTIEANDDLRLIICDVNMPRMNGIQMIERIAENGGVACPILMLTTEGEPQLIMRAKAAGARGWIVKPVDDVLLVKTARALVS